MQTLKHTHKPTLHTNLGIHWFVLRHNHESLHHFEKQNYGNASRPTADIAGVIDSVNGQEFFVPTGKTHTWSCPAISPQSDVICGLSRRLSDAPVGLNLRPSSNSPAKDQVLGLGHYKPKLTDICHHSNSPYRIVPYFHPPLNTQ